jgi:hypothetical protein
MVRETEHGAALRQWRVERRTASLNAAGRERERERERESVELASLDTLRGRASWVTLRARWVTLRARWVTLRALAG